MTTPNNQEQGPPAETEEHSTEIAFSRMDGCELDTLAVIVFEHHAKLDTEAAVLAALKQGVTNWVKTTKEGKEAWEDSVEDLNIGDLDGHENNPELQASLAAEGITDWDCIFSLSIGNQVSYDKILVHEDQLEEEEEEKLEEGE